MAFSARKNFFSKIGHSHVLGIANTHLCAKNQKKIMLKLRKGQKSVFSGIFLAFSARKFFFENRLHHILDITILHQCAKFDEKISSTARYIQEIPFVRRKLAVPVIFRKIRLQKSVLLTIKTCSYRINMEQIEVTFSKCK